MTTSRWILPPPLAPTEAELAEALARRLGCPASLAGILARRGGVVDPDEAVWPPVYANEWCGDFTLRLMERPA